MDGLSLAWIGGIGGILGFAIAVWVCCVFVARALDRAVGYWREEAAAALQGNELKDCIRYCESVRAIQVLEAMRTDLGVGGHPDVGDKRGVVFGAHDLREQFLRERRRSEDRAG